MHLLIPQSVLRKRKPSGASSSRNTPPTSSPWTNSLALSDLSIPPQIQTTRAYPTHTTFSCAVRKSCQVPNVSTPIRNFALVCATMIRRLTRTRKVSGIILKHLSTAAHRMGVEDWAWIVSCSFILVCRIFVSRPCSRGIRAGRPLSSWSMYRD